MDSDPGTSKRDRIAWAVGVIVFAALLGRLLTEQSTDILFNSDEYKYLIVADSLIEGHGLAGPMTADIQNPPG